MESRSISTFVRNTVWTRSISTFILTVTLGTHRRGTQQEVLVRLHAGLPQATLDPIQTFKALERWLGVFRESIYREQRL